MYVEKYFNILDFRIHIQKFLKNAIRLSSCLKYTYIMKYTNISVLFL